MKVAKPVFTVLKYTLKYGFKTVLVAAEAPFWIGYGVKKAVDVSADAINGRRSMRHGILHCPRGHEIPIEGGTYQCEACGYIYTGSILRCGSAECGATTPYINCCTPGCGLSVRNPYRVGKP